MTDRISCIRQVVEAHTPRWMFEGGMREAAREALAVLGHEAEEGVDVVVLPTRGTISWDASLTK
jgi:hypothetical protein